MNKIKKEKIIGILGGMGPEATIDLFKKIVKLTAAIQDQDHLRIIIDNNPKIPDRTKAILYGEGNPLPSLIKTAKNLKKAGADFIIIPCNTAHYYYDKIQEAVCIPILNMIQETSIFVHKMFPFIKNISLFATQGTYKSQLYQLYFNNFAIKIMIPSEMEQNELMEIIYRIKGGYNLDLLKKQVIKIIYSQINNGAQGIITGCTELSLIIEEKEFTIPIIDPTLVLAQKAIEKATK